MIGEVTNHLWQSTLITAVAFLLVVVLRRNQAQIRYWIWLIASVKFLIPFSLLIALGSALERAPGADQLTDIAAQIATPSVSFTAERIARPFTNIVPSTSSTPEPGLGANGDWIPFILLGIWACGFAGIAFMRFHAWRGIRRALAASTALKIPGLEIPPSIQLRSCLTLLEPGVVGFLRPVVLLPADIVDRLTLPQLKAVLTHELHHVRRHDNLTAAVHMLVEAVFWFYPLVWWIGARLVEERERACDEEVLRVGNESDVYAAGILNVCKLYKESSLLCAPGVTGFNLKRRVEAIMRNSVALKLSLSRSVLLTVTAFAVLLGPVVIGAVTRTAASRPSEGEAATNSTGLAAAGQQSGQDQLGAQLPVPIKNPDDIQFKTSAFTFVRIKYSGVPDYSWAVDYPAADRKFSAHVQNITGLSTNGEGLVLELTDSNLSRYPFIYIVEGGRMSLSDAEVAGLRQYLLGGGFLMVDDFWGEEEWASLSGELRRVFPNREPVELSTDHEIFRSFYEFNEKPRVPSVEGAQQGDTSGGESATGEPHYFGLLDDMGRLMAILCHNADFGDAWEDVWESEGDPAYPSELSWGRGIPMGVNIAVYALSH
jgi:beta-lactamase regulating signal transducer with metallopeptidase domain